MAIKNKSTEKSFPIFLPKGKRGVSVIIGYVLLVAVVIAISVIVYQWLKSYVPTSALSCPSGVAVSVPDFVYNCSYASGKEMLNFTFENTGTFSISGYLIHAENSTNQTLATIDLSPYYINGTGTGYVGSGRQIFFGSYFSGENSVTPAGNTFSTIKKQFNGFLIPKSLGNLTSIEIIPVRYVKYNGQTLFATCGSASITQELSCT